MDNLGSWRTSDHEGEREFGGLERSCGHSPKDLLEFQCKWTLTRINLIPSEEDNGFKLL